MKQAGFLLSIILLNLVFTSAIAQDTLLLLNGKQRLIRDFQYNNDKTSLIFNTLKGKQKGVDLNDIFSVIDSTNHEHIFYSPDTIEFLLETEQMRSYMLGERDARQQYKPRWAFISGFAAGVVSPVLGRYALVLPVSYGITTSFIPKPQTYLNTHNIGVNKPHYSLGYKDIIKQKRLRNSLLGGALGFAISAVAWEKFFN